MNAILGLGLLLGLAGAAHAAPPATSCTTCHLDPTRLGEDARALAKILAEDVHARAGLSCHDCHGGNPDPALASDRAAAMDAAYTPAPYRKPPERGDVPAFCGRCHSDAVYMKRFDPAARIDQEREYWTSRHGIELARGNPQVATCVSCHGAHGIRSAGDPRSPVYPLHVAETCATCHADAEHMAGARREDGSPLPIDQYARWRRSVHADALLGRGDLSAPTCNDCHGNHGAVPPGVDSVSLVCGHCHGREAELFRASAKREGFLNHNRFLSSVGGNCAACHPPPAPQAALTGIRHFAECATCHENHAVVRPTLVSLLPLPPYPCAFCHEDTGSANASALEPEQLIERYTRTRNELLIEAGGRRGDELFDWMLDRALTLPAHHVSQRRGGDREQALSPAFSRLLQRFRIGKTYFVYEDPETGTERRESVVRCGNCHTAEPLLGKGQGYRVAEEQMWGMREVMSLSARAERILLRARAGGVPVQAARSNLDAAVDDQIGLEVLVHAFHTGPGSTFSQTHAEGIEHARAALAGGQAALTELGARRRGLAVSLVLIALVLIGLGLKIRGLGGSGASGSDAATEPPR
jgi:hypothetical protein